MFLYLLEEANINICICIYMCVCVCVPVSYMYNNINNIYVICIIYIQHKWGMIVPRYDCINKVWLYDLAWHSHTLFVLHILTYNDFLRIQLFLEIWIVSKIVDVGSILFTWIINNGNTRTMCKICSKLTIKTLKRCHVSLLLTLNRFHTFF